MLDPLKFQLEHHSADLRPVSNIGHSEVYRALFQGPKDDGLSKARLLENLYMVATGIRPSSMFHPLDIDEVVQAHEPAERLGVGMVVRKCGKLVYKVFLFGKEKELLAFRIPDMDESMGRKEFIIGQITIANLTGALLDYPECCVKSFLDHLMQGTDQDREAVEALRAHPDPDQRAYFMERFVPCRPDCPNAVEEGRRIEKEIKEKAPRLLDMYLELRQSHMEDVRSGSVVREKEKRNSMLR